MVYSRQELIALSEILLKHPHVYIVTDDMYEHIYWSAEPFFNILTVCPELKKRTIVTNGVSKSYAMTGWRIGYAAGPEAIINAMTIIQSQSTSNPNSIAQMAAVTALESSQQCVADMAKAYERRHALIYNALKNMPGVKCHPASGAFYSFPDFNETIKKHHSKNDIDFTEALLNATGIVAIPGSAFGTPNCIRFSYATSDDLIIEAMKRLESFLKA